ncbi:MAG: hypothetical protein AABZ06_14500 [Bdellovibrionota bacterium]
MIQLMCAVLILGMTWQISAFGDEQEPEIPQVQPSASHRPKLKGKKSREKEVEGTEALDRFEADTIIKSKYQYNGEYLEVDPD